MAFCKAQKQMTCSKLVGHNKNNYVYIFHILFVLLFPLLYIKCHKKQSKVCFCLCWHVKLHVVTCSLKCSKSLNGSLAYFLYIRVIELTVIWGLPFYRRIYLFFSPKKKKLVMVFMAKSRTIYWGKMKCTQLIPSTVPCAC